MARQGGALVAAAVVVFLVITSSFVSAKKHHHDDENREAEDVPEILKWLAQFSELPAPAQDVVLIAAGATLQAQFGMDCNIFSGQSACKALPADSAFVKQCPSAAATKVDCVAFGDVQHNIYDSPVDDLAAYLGTQARDACPQCFARVQDLWCALAVPPCGNFASQLQNGLLPVLSQVVNDFASNAGSSRPDALAPNLPNLLDLAQSGLPCREMCQSVLDTCSCSECGDTLGSLMTWLASQPQLQDRARVPLTQARTLFKQVWDRPFCSLFPPQGTPGVVGTCNVAPVEPCSKKDTWCAVTTPPKDAASSSGSAVKYIQSILLLQYIRATTGWLTNDDALIWSIHKNVKDETMASCGKGGSEPDGMMGGSSGAARTRDSMAAGQIVGITFLSLVLAGLAAAGVASGVRWWRARQSEKSYMSLATSEHFISLEQPTTANVM